MPLRDIAIVQRTQRQKIIRAASIGKSSEGESGKGVSSDQ
jgi:hypothetical protein